MQVEKFFELVGGRKVVMDETGLSKQSMSLWVREKKITDHWMKFFKLRFPREYKQAGGK